MKNLKRRAFIGWCMKSAALALLGVLPGTFFSKKKLFAQVESFSSVLQRTTKTNVFTILKASRLTPEEKLAILAVRELPREQVSRTISMIDNFGTLAAGQGQCCGNNCANSGQLCGSNCGPEQQEPGPEQQQLAICVLDKSGKLDINFSSLNKRRFKSFLELAQKLT